MSLVLYCDDFKKVICLFNPVNNLADMNGIFDVIISLHKGILGVASIIGFAIGVTNFILNLPTELKLQTDEHIIKEQNPPPLLQILLGQVHVAFEFVGGKRRQ